MYYEIILPFLKMIFQIGFYTMLLLRYFYIMFLRLLIIKLIIDFRSIRWDTSKKNEKWIGIRNVIWSWSWYDIDVFSHIILCSNLEVRKFFKWIKRFVYYVQHIHTSFLQYEWNIFPSRTPSPFNKRSKWRPTIPNVRMSIKREMGKLILANRILCRNETPWHISHYRIYSWPRNRHSKPIKDSI